jgi:molybdopterin/thiamine biosynthesis adenylyltransferase
MALSPEELERYARHIVMPEVGGPGQNKLKKSSVLVIGAGGLGAPALQYLAAAGVGRIGICDHDSVSLSNLQRQTIHSMDFLGKPKTVSAANFIAHLNPHVDVIQHQFRITPEDALALVSAYDVICDASDNFSTRFLVADACYFAKKPLVSAAVGQFDGQISTFKPYLKDASGTPLPTYRCFIGELPEPGMFPACEEAGILGALPGILGSMQAMEVIKELLEIGDSLAGRILMYDALAARFFETTLTWNPDNPLTGKHPSVHGIISINYSRQN